MANQLYYIIATDADGENKTLFACAESPAAAFEQWQLYYHPDYQEWADEGMGLPHDYTGPVTVLDDDQRITYAKDGYTAIGITEVDLRIYEVSTDLSVARPYAWCSDEIKLVAYVEEAC